jgi:D-beta-D-heptose 7-phosphate kinase/D-beta-D-heptose 1-phosphate adenosyltransferase
MRRVPPGNGAGLVGRLGGVRVLVVGDVILDERVSGRATRLSPEAPVPVIEVVGTTWAAGGAANVAANIAGLGGEACLVGLVGDDEEAARLAAVVAGLPRVEARFHRDATRPTTRKIRVVAQGQQILRMDREARHAPSPGLLDRLIREAVGLVERVDAVVLSDYAKGTLEPSLLRAILDASPPRPSVVDPKHTDTARYEGASVITPNEAEACAAADAPDADRAGERLLERHPVVLVTRGPSGATLFRRGREPFHAAATPRPVFDRTGAGDTVAAALGLALGAGLCMEEAVILANHAAGIVVGAPGTRVATAAELQASLDGG